jgi:hypothetical protein
MLEKDRIFEWKRNITEPDQNHRDEMDGTVKFFLSQAGFPS